MMPLLLSCSFDMVPLGGLSNGSRGGCPPRLASGTQSLQGINSGTYGIRVDVP
jgi:hypothetical protein